MGEVVHAATAADACEAVASAIADRRTLEIVGRGSRWRLGRRVDADARLDLSRLAGVVTYEPQELVLTAWPGTPLAEIEALLAGERQHLAFEPPDFGPLWGEPEGRGALGGAICVGLGGPRRMSAGGPRDHLLGFKAVNGFGEPFAAGGRVVKNVTGFDLPKLMAGSYGALGVLTEVTLKVLPAPEAVCTVWLSGLEEAAGLDALRQAMACPLPPTGAAHLPADVVPRLPGAEALRGRAATLLRVEGTAAAAGVAAERLAREVGGGGILDEEVSRRLWRGVAGAAAFAGADTAVWRISAPPAAAAALGEALRRAGMISLYYDWAGGLVWAEAPQGGHGGALAVRRALRRAAGEGHALLVRGPEALQARISGFRLGGRRLAPLEARIRAQFDPLGLFNPGRMGRA